MREPVEMDVNIDIFDADVLGKRSLDRVGKYTVASFRSNMLSNRELFMKRALDIVGNSMGMVILVMAAIFVASVIKLDYQGR